MPEPSGSQRSSGEVRGLFLAFEGVEGSGKSTQARLLGERLEAAGVPVIVAREPGTTELGERIRQTVLSGVDLTIPARSELFLMLAARAAFVDQVIRPGLAEGRIVIADRFELSTLAYQGMGRGIPLADIRHCNQLATGGVQPDLTILLELPPEEGARRQRAAGKRPDRLEGEGLEFHRRVADGYLELAAGEPRLARVEAAGNVDTVHRRVVRELAAHFPETFPPGGFITEQQSGRDLEPDARDPRTASEAE